MGSTAGLAPKHPHPSTISKAYLDWHENMPSNSTCYFNPIKILPMSKIFDTKTSMKISIEHF